MARKKSDAPGDLLKWGEHDTDVSDSWLEQGREWSESGLGGDPMTHIGHLPLACAEKFRNYVPVFQISPRIYSDRDGVLGVQEMSLLLRWPDVSHYPMKLDARWPEGGWSDTRINYAIAELKRKAAIYAWDYFCSPKVTTPGTDPRFAGRRALNPALTSASGLVGRLKF